MLRAPEAVAKIASTFPGLRLLAMHGSRARGDAHGGSDWDFAYLASEGFDELALRAALCRALGTDDIDLADLSRSGGLLRYRVARDGVVVHESVAGTFDDFCYDAILFWLDAQHVIRAEHAGVLEALG